jgi:GTP cyclohydrolase II
MNHIPFRDESTPAPLPSGVESYAGEPTESLQTAAVSRLRHVHRAASDLKRGTPVVMCGDTEIIIIPAETAGARGLAELAEAAAGPAVLLLATSRAVSILHRPLDASPATALRLSPALFDPAVLHSLADPTAEHLLPEPPVPAPLPAHATAALALAKLARLLPAVIAAPARADLPADLLRVAAQDVLDYPLAMATSLVRVAEASVPLEDAPDARVVAFRAPDSGIEHLAILVGTPEDDAAPLVRVHSECFTGDLLGSLRCDCGPQLRSAIRKMAEEGSGVLLYLAQEGRGIGLVNKLRAYAMQDRGLDTLDANVALGWGADERNFLVAATMLDQLGIERIRLLTNNPDKVAALVACGVDVVERVTHVIAPNGVNDFYLGTKASRFGHMLG